MDLVITIIAICTKIVYDASMCAISVIMGIYNEKNRTHVIQAIDSILQQSFTDFEFIICDDGSTNEFYTWLKDVCKRDSRIRLLHNDKNMGLSYTLNRCMEHASGKYYARMDADDISKEKRLEKQFLFLESHPKFAIVGCNAEFIDDQGVWGKHSMVEIPQKEDFLRTSVFIHPTVLVRAEVMQKLGGYSTEVYALRIEDYELFMRLYAVGYCGYNLQEFLFQYREDVQAFHKRKYRYRVNETRVRYRGFRALGILKGNWNYVIKPLIAGVVPAQVMQKHRKKQFGV